MDFKAALKKDKKIIDRALRAYLKKEKSASKALLRAMRYALFPGGKRLRPALCLMAARCSGGKAESAVPAACAIEFVHTFSLIHDDLPSMDDDDMRRGKPSCHVKFGEAVAVLAGDALQNLAFLTLSGIKNKKISSALAGTLAEAVGAGGMIGGQELDTAPGEKSNALESRINDLKTARLFQASLAMGAIASGATEKKKKKLEDFGKYFGKAFQIYDDINDRKYDKKAVSRKKKELKGLINRAKSSLESFGKKADNLRYVADKLAEREILRFAQNDNKYCHSEAPQGPKNLK